MPIRPGIIVTKFDVADKARIAGHARHGDTRDDVFVISADSRGLLRRPRGASGASSVALGFRARL